MLFYNVDFINLDPAFFKSEAASILDYIKDYVKQQIPNPDRVYLPGEITAYSTLELAKNIGCPREHLMVGVNIQYEWTGCIGEELGIRYAEHRYWNTTEIHPHPNIKRILSATDISEIIDLLPEYIQWRMKKWVIYKNKVTTTDRLLTQAETGRLGDRWKEKFWEANSPSLSPKEKALAMEKLVQDLLAV